MAVIQKTTSNLSSKPKFSVAIQSDGYKKLINNTLGDPKVAQRFIANISSVVSNNYQLQQCEPSTILSAGFQAESLNLPLNQSLGYAYVVPYRDKAQFQIGYKGFVQLAIRSGQYLDIDVFTIKDGEYKGRDKITGKPIFEFIENDEVAEAKDVVGYMATFTLLNGFTKNLYWSKEKVEAHAKQYSKSYGNGSKTDLWTNQFDSMAMKTVLKQLLNRYGLLSVELQQAMESDQAVIDEKGNKQYVDNSENELDNDTGEIIDEPTNDTQKDKITTKSPKNDTKQDNLETQDVSNLFEQQFDEF